MSKVKAVFRWAEQWSQMPVLLSFGLAVKCFAVVIYTVR